VATIDQLTQHITGCYNTYGIDSFEGRNHAKGTMSWYKPNFFAGNHDFKFGADYAAAHADRKISSRNGTKSEQTGFPKGHVGNYRLIYRTPPGAAALVPFAMDAWSNCYKDGEPDCVPKDLTHTLWLYAQDSWTIARRLTLNLGARYAHAVGFIPEQCRSASDPPLETVYPAKCWDRIEFPTWNSIVPRVHAAYDLTGNGATVIKGGYGRFAHNWHSDELQMANENVHLVTRFLWRDLNGNTLYDPGEINFDLNGPDFVSTSLFTGGEDGLAGAVPNPNLKEPMSDEFSLSIERELMPNFAIRATGIYSRQQTFRVQNNLRPYAAYNIPITSPDPGPDGVLGTADDPGASITWYQYPASLAGRQFQQPMLINSPADDQTYKTFEIAASKRFDRRWMLMASYSATKIDLPHWQNTASTGNDFTNPGLQVFLATYDPNAEINTRYNLWEWTGRLDTAYILPAAVQVSANFEHRSGQPWARTVNFRAPAGQPIPNIVLRTEPIGAQRLPDINLLHMRVEKAFRMGQGRTLAARLNLFNVTNINTEQSITQLSGVNFGRPGNVMAPRIAEFGVEYRF
jgi:outer membrane receptor protein involved in Fe transport